jgi:hypothetical protein
LATTAHSPNGAMILLIQVAAKTCFATARGR